MFISIVASLLLVAITTLIHYETLRGLYSWLPDLAMPQRSKLLVVIFAAMVAHGVEIAVYGVTLFGMVRFLDVGTLAGPAGFSLINSLYFSAETYTSLGFGDLTPTGPVRLLAGVEALNGLLLIGWSASFTYIAMERFWNLNSEKR